MNLLTIASLCVFACGAAVAAPRATIELLQDVQVQGESVCLGEVAHLQSTDLALMRKLVSLPLGRAPRVGEPATVQRARLADWLRQQAALAPEELEWRGAESARITRRADVVRGQAIAAAAAEALRALLESQGMVADLEPRPMPRDFDAPGPDVRLQVRSLGHLPVRSRMVVWVDLWNGDTFVRSVPVAFQVAQALGPVGHATPALLQASPRAVDVPMLVARGEWATLRSNAGLVTLESRVEVLQDGHAGQRVRVRSHGATGIVFARVVGPAQLELAP